MRAPGFWYRDAGLLARVLRPFGWLYAQATAWRVSWPGMQADVPVICVGNLNAGGTGKTPTVMSLIDRLSARGVTAHVVSRGHGGRLAGPVRVLPSHTAADVGDEPLLLAAFAPVWVARDRATGVKAATAAGAQVVILDDGFQNPSVIKDLSIIVVDAGIGFGNGLCLPAGPLREPVDVGLARADFLLSIGNPAAQAQFGTDWPLPQVTGALQPLATGMDWQGTRVLAFAGIGHPEKFFATLAAMGANIIRTVALDDHQPLTDGILTRLAADARTLGAQLVTTEKDAVRLPAAYQGQVMVLPVRLMVDDWAALDSALAELGL